jgi:hypothetical protein
LSKSFIIYAWPEHTLYTSPNSSSASETKS